MGFAGNYLNKQGIPPILPDPPSGNLSYAVVIPAYCETDLTRTLECLWNCTRPEAHVEVIVVVNHPESANEDVRKLSYLTAEAVRTFSQVHDEEHFRFRVIEAYDLPEKHAGAGLARKTGMDEALRRFDRIGHAKGLIISLDADCLVDEDYFMAIEANDRKLPFARAFNLYFEHPLDPAGHEEKVIEGIVRYELHMRYVNQCLRFAGFPFAYHTVGSAFAVRADVYAGQGGMNRRKAGEDFYFLHKVIPLGNFHEINDTRVIPSPRPSDRAPFGTGAAISRYISSGGQTMTTYHPEGFLMLKTFFALVPSFFMQPPGCIENLLDQCAVPLKDYLEDLEASSSIREINNNSSSPVTFYNRFFRWFDAFRVVKFLNHAARDIQPPMEVKEAASWFLTQTGKEMTSPANEMQLLLKFREMERQGRGMAIPPR